MSLPPWDLLTFTFGWEPWEYTMRQCTDLKVEFSTELAPGYVANPPPAPPYTVIILAGGYRPLIMAVGNTARNGTFEWVVNLPLGPQYLMAMKDSAGYNAGTSLLWSMSAGNGSCALDPSPLTPSSLSFARTGSAQCGEVNYVMNNGTSPYQIEIFPEIHQRRTLYFATNKFGFIMDLPTGLNVYVAITDADGNSGVDQLMTVGTSSDNSCLKAAGTVSAGRVSTMYSGSGVPMTATATPVKPSPTSTVIVPTQSGNNKSSGGTNLPIIVGAVAGIVGLAFFIVVVLFIYHRRKARRAPEAQPPADLMQQVNLPQNPQNYHGVPQYPSIGIPQIQTPDPHVYAPSPYTGSYFGPTPPSDAYTQHFGNVTTHTPRPHSYQTGQSVLLDGNTSSVQSAYTPRLSQGSENMLIASQPSLGTSTPGEKQRISPSLPPGALPPSSTSPGLSEYWVPQTPGTPANNHPPFPGSPRSETATVLPPYEPADKRG